MSTLGLAVGRVWPEIERKGRRPNRGPIILGLCLCLLLFLVAVPTAVRPTPIWIQYFGLPISFLFPLLVYLLGFQRGGWRVLSRGILGVALVTTLIANGPDMLQALKAIQEPARWQPVRVRETALDIRADLARRNLGDGLVATLSPLYAVEANLEIYPELATGPFLYRVARLLSAGQRQHYVGIDPTHVGDLMAQDPPAAVFVGYEGGLDDPLRAYARQAGYRQVGGYDRGTLFVQPRGR
jgi:hypothetical protein